MYSQITVNNELRKILSHSVKQEKKSYDEYIHNWIISACIPEENENFRKLESL